MNFQHGDVFFDTETTGLGQESPAQIVEIAIVDADGKELLRELVLPEFAQMEAKARETNRLSDEELARDGKPWREVWPRVEQVFKTSQRIWAFGAPFDTRMLRDTNKLAGLPEPSAAVTARVQCAKDFADRTLKVLHGPPPSGYSKYSLQDALKVLDPLRRGVQTHRAADDARDTLFVVKALGEPVSRRPKIM
jgi:DNA polymerase III epsilon subunit-like protein